VGVADGVALGVLLGVLLAIDDILRQRHQELVPLQGFEFQSGYGFPVRRISQEDGQEGILAGGCHHDPAPADALDRSRDGRGLLEEASLSSIHLGILIAIIIMPWVPLRLARERVEQAKRVGVDVAVAVLPVRKMK